MNKRTITNIFFWAIIIAIAAGFFASSKPDGLEKVARHLKIDNSITSTPGVMADYTLSILNVPGYSTAASGILGILIVFFLFRFISRGNKLIDSIKEIFRTISKKD
jgi:ABC-type sulfate transport system permease component